MALINPLAVAHRGACHVWEEVPQVHANGDRGWFLLHQQGVCTILTLRPALGRLDQRDRAFEHTGAQQNGVMDGVARNRCVVALGELVVNLALHRIVAVFRLFDDLLDRGLDTAGLQRWAAWQLDRVVGRQLVCELVGHVQVGHGRWLDDVETLVAGEQHVKKPGLAQVHQASGQRHEHAAAVLVGFHEGARVVYAVELAHVPIPALFCDLAQAYLGLRLASQAMAQRR